MIQKTELELYEAIEKAIEKRKKWYHNWW